MPNYTDTIYQAIHHILSQHPELIDPIFRLTAGAQGPWQNGGSGITHSRVLPLATVSPWLDDVNFKKVYELVKSNTLVDIYRCYELWQLAKQLEYVPGDILEVGVWRGGTGAILAEAVRHLKDKTVFLADTFTGVVKAGENDTRYTGGEHSDTSEELVQALLASMSLSNVKVLRGIFPEATQHHIPGKIALLHCDVDVYQSSKDIIEWSLPRLSIGSLLVFDDYGFSGCEGITLFCNEFKARRDFRFIHNLNGHAVFVRVAV